MQNSFISLFKRVIDIQNENSIFSLKIHDGIEGFPVKWHHYIIKNSFNFIKFRNNSTSKFVYIFLLFHHVQSHKSKIKITFKQYHTSWRDKRRLILTKISNILNKSLLSFFFSCSWYNNSHSTNAQVLSHFTRFFRLEGSTKKKLTFYVW